MNDATPNPLPARDPGSGDALARRLSRIEGQVRALRGHVLEDGYCLDLAGEVAAIRSALDAVAGEIVARHVRTCLAGRESASAHPSARTKTPEELATELGGILKRLLG